MERAGNGNRIVQYLLGRLPEDERRQFDEQLFTNADYFERLVATEDELIDDYLLGRLPSSERQQFEKTFLTNPFLRKKVALAKALIDYIDSRVEGSGGSQAIPPLHLQRAGFGPQFRPKKDKPSAGLLLDGLRNYRLSLYVIAAVRVAILALIWFLIFRATVASGFNSSIIFYILTTLFALYVPLEAVSMLRAIKEARLALAASQAEADPS